MISSPVSNSQGSYIVNASAYLWQIKFIISMFIFIIFIIKLYRRIRFLRYLSDKPIDGSLFSTINALVYADRVWGSSGIGVLFSIILFHILLVAILIFHLPIFISIIYSIITFGRRPFFLIKIINIFYYSFGGYIFVMGLVSLLIIIIIIINKFMKGLFELDNRFLLQILTILALLTGVGGYHYSIVEPVHAIIGYISILYLLVTDRGLHWANVIIHTIHWYRMRIRF